MDIFDVQVLGCGSALPTKRHVGSSQVVNIHGKCFLVDCAEGTQLQMRRFGVSFSRINNIFISHLHGDHCFGLLGLLSSLGLLGRKSKMTVYGPQGIRDVYSGQMEFFCSNIGYEVEFKEFDAKVPTVLYEDKGIVVSTLPLRHKIPCSGFLFSEKNSRHIRRDVIDAYGIPVSQINNIKAGMDYVLEDGEVIPYTVLTSPPTPERKYAYCSDTAYSEALVPLIKGVDLLYHESTYMERDIEMAKKYKHSTARQAASIAKSAGVRKLMLGHYSSKIEDENMLLGEAKEVFDETILSFEGLKIKV